MKSPFPGMDPYLEDQGRWPDFHASMITYCRDALSERLQDDYVAQMEASSQSSGGVATLEPVAIPFASAVDEVRDTWVEIRRLPDERLVTAIEVLSPTNKGSSGLPEYLDKRQRLRDERVNLVEIDLLIAGRRLPMARSLPPAHYYTFVARRSKPESADVYAWSLDSSLPTIPIPLEAPDPDTLLDLAEIFALAYRRGRYARLINYSKSLSLPLHPQDKEWVEKVALGR